MSGRGGLSATPGRFDLIPFLEVNATETTDRNTKALGDFQPEELLISLSGAGLMGGPVRTGKRTGRIYRRKLDSVDHLRRQQLFASHDATVYSMECLNR
jgi:hypothetical protein